MSSCNIGHIQYPLLHAATSLSATVKHTRRIPDSLLSAELDFSTNVTLTYSRDGSVSRSSDKRPVTQSCVVVMSAKSENKWTESECVQSGVIGPLPVISVSEMQGYDPENKPSPGQRASENFGMSTCRFFYYLNTCMDIGFGFPFLYSNICIIISKLFCLHCGSLGGFCLLFKLCF